MSHVECETPPGARMFEAVCGILDTYDRDPAKLIPILQAVQAQYRYLPEEVLTYVATSLGLPPARVYGVATFYAHFTLEPKGKHVVRVCDGTACHVKGSTRILEGMQKLLGLYATDKTLQLHKPQESPYIQECYEWTLQCPGSETAHDLLHTHYHGRRRIADEDLDLLRGGAPHRFRLPPAAP